MNEEAKKDLTAMLQVLNLPPLEQQLIILSLPHETCKRWKAYIGEIKIIVKTLEEVITTGKLPARIYFEVPKETPKDYLIHFAAGALGYDKSETEPRCFKHKALDIELKLVEPGQGLELLLADEKLLLASTATHGNA